MAADGVAEDLEAALVDGRLLLRVDVPARKREAREVSVKAGRASSEQLRRISVPLLRLRLLRLLAVVRAAAYVRSMYMRMSRIMIDESLCLSHLSFSSLMKLSSFCSKISFATA